jgi:hypothetical protein
VLLEVAVGGSGGMAGDFGRITRTSGTPPHSDTEVPQGERPPFLLCSKIVSQDGIVIVVIRLSFKSLR